MAAVFRRVINETRGRPYGGTGRVGRRSLFAFFSFLDGMGMGGALACQGRTHRPERLNFSYMF